MLDSGRGSDHPSNQPKARCFGSNAAITVEASILQSKGEAGGDTVNIDVAGRKGETVDWQNKITFQLSESELALFASVCLGYLPSCEFKRPGKGIKIERQPGKLYVTASRSDARFSLPVPIGQVFQISTLVLSQLQKHSFVTGETLIASLRGAAALFRPA